MRRENVGGGEVKEEKENVEGKQDGNDTGIHKKRGSLRFKCCRLKA